MADQSSVYIKSIMLKKLHETQTKHNQRYSINFNAVGYRTTVDFNDCDSNSSLL